MALFSNPAKAAQPYLQQIPGAVQPYYQPYITQGQQAQNQAAGSYERMAQNPSDFINQLMASYSPSKGFEFQRDQGLKAARNSAAQGGFSGTEYDQMKQAELANSLAHTDMQEWLKNVLGVQGSGLAGQQHLGNQGYYASRDYGDILGSTLNQQAGLAFQGQGERNDLFAKLIGLGAGEAGAALGRGYSNFGAPRSSGFDLPWNSAPGIGFKPPYSEYLW